jgi:hypothetical protein
MQTGRFRTSQARSWLIKSKEKALIALFVDNGY